MISVGFSSIRSSPRGVQLPSSCRDTNPETALIIKHATNVFLPSKISLINRLRNTCKEFGLDMCEMMDAIGLDDRITVQFRRSGVGWAGSWFPTDVAAIAATARDAGYEPAMLVAAVEINEADGHLVVIESTMTR